MTLLSVRPGLPDNGKRFAPVTLPREKPVAQLVGRRAFAMSSFLEPPDNFLFCFRSRQSVHQRRVDGHAVAEKADRFLRSPVGRLHDRQNWQIELAGELEIPLVVS